VLRAVSKKVGDYSLQSLSLYSHLLNTVHNRQQHSTANATTPTTTNHVVSVTDPYGRIIGFKDRSRYFSFK
jgi:hypothetical protein